MNEWIAVNKKVVVQVGAIDWDNRWVGTVVEVERHNGTLVKLYR
jgi:hypothetical protein